VEQPIGSARIAGRKPRQERPVAAMADGSKAAKRRTLQRTSVSHEKLATHVQGAPSGTPLRSLTSARLEPARPREEPATTLAPAVEVEER
jgi:hypothetical protein